MAKRGYKLQEFVAHSSSVNCLRIGKKACRLLLTGGDDHRVNLWAIGKPTSLTSLCGHTSPVECLAFDSAENLVLGGASSGAIKLWNLEEAKMVRTLTGHISNCTTVEFHPFGEFFASGSHDTDLTIWDIRKKGCIHTYKGHSLGIDTIKFTPDGRWVVSGGRDKVVKVWDLTAGKLLHDFNSHDGPIRSLDFHPLEFLLATGSADRTVKFWDLETFEMIGSSRIEATGVGALNFHPDGRTLFCGYEDNMKVYSWEPVICHDSFDIGGSPLGDLCVSDTKVVACSHYQNSIAIWVADLSLIEPYRIDDVPKDSCSVELKPEPQEKHQVEKMGTATWSTSGSCPVTPDADTKEIKNIYVDYEKPISSQKLRSRHMRKTSVPSVMKEFHKLSTKKQSPGVAVQAKPERRATSRSFVVPSIVPRDSSGGKDVATARRGSSGPTGSGSGTPIRSVHTRRATSSTMEVSSVAESRSLHGTTDYNYNKSVVSEDGPRESFEDKYPTAKRVEEKFEAAEAMTIPSSLETVDNSSIAKRNGGKLENGVARVRGRTRSLVEQFEKGEKLFSDEDMAVDQTANIEPDVLASRIKSSTMLKDEPQVSGRDSASSSDDAFIEELIQGHDALLVDLRYRLTKLQVVKHFWERNDLKGAIDAMQKLPDHSVQADVISVFMDKMEILNLDLFCSLLPVLVCLLDSKIERHTKMSLETLLKLVALFGEIICSTMSAPPAVGVDLHQEQRIECCRQCFKYLQKVRNALPALARRGGLLAKSALELNLVLQDHDIA